MGHTPAPKCLPGLRTDTLRLVFIAVKLALIANSTLQKELILTCIPRAKVL